MDKDILEKHTNDPTWAEVIRLYSGLFDTQDEREDFILDLAEKDILLAAECKTSSMEEERNLKQSIVNITHKFKNDANDSAIYSLLELQKYDMAFDVIRDKTTLTNSSYFFNKILSYIKQAFQFYQLMDICVENKKLKSYFVTFLSFGKMEKSFDVNKNEIVFFMDFFNNLVKHNINPSFVFFSFNIQITKQIHPILINTITYLKIIGISNRAEQLINKYAIKSANFDFLTNPDVDFIELFLNELRRQYLDINTEKFKSEIKISIRKGLFFDFKKIVQKKLQINDREFIGLINSIKLKAIVERHTEYGIQVKLLKFRKAFGILKNHLIVGLNDDKKMYPGQLINVRIIDFHTKQKATFIFSMKDFEEKNRVYIIQDSFDKENFSKFSEVLKNRVVIGKKYTLDAFYSELEQYTGKTFKNNIWTNNIKNYLVYLSYFKIATIVNDTITFNELPNNSLLCNSIKVIPNNIIVCDVTKIISHRIFVKIENETRSASIYIGELANKRINNILDFEYNGVKLHVGQKLIAKVINIDKQGRINLSLKQVQNEE